MAFLTNVAASKKGAEDLLDAGIFEQLSMCSFVSVQPMREEIMGELHYAHWREDKLISRWFTTRFSRSTTSRSSLRIAAPYKGFVESTSIIKDWSWSCMSFYLIQLSR